MRIVFAGTPEIAATMLLSLLSTQHEIVAVLTQPDRQAGRGQKLVMSPVKMLALEHQIPVYQPLRLKDPEIQATLKNLQPDLMIVVAYGLIIPQEVLNIPRFGCWNVHVSLLPRWRGAAPIQRAIEAGDTETGISLMQMEAGLDTGPILLQERVEITANMTAGTLHDLLSLRGAHVLREGLVLQQAGKLKAIPQSEVGVTYAHKLKKEEALLKWNLPAKVLEQKIRAFNPWPICNTHYADQTIRIWQARCPSRNTNSEPQQPGQIAYLREDAIGVQTGDGILELLTIQLPAAKALPVGVFLNGHRDFFQIGNCFI